jgi:hypothetical protein
MSWVAFPVSLHVPYASRHEAIDEDFHNSQFGIVLIVSWRIIRPRHLATGPLFLWR